ncbi:MAG: metallophosphoesterase [Hyphomonadaceae bacterium JAD_PAG50586_4]|nr:MAG: metallophosphoesterase [Hyphomonadaceae bacterium JAD_PAG50586_4]
MPVCAGRAKLAAMLHPQLLPAGIGAVIGFALIAWAAVWLVRRWRTLSRRKRWIVFAAIAIVESAYWINIYAWFIEPNTLVVRHVEIVSENWSGAPLTIAAISDVHVGGPHVDAARMGRIVQRLNELRPELVVMLGDFVNGHAPEAERTPTENQEILGGIATFGALNARYGAVAAIGNHDSWYGRGAVTTALQDAGVAALWNRHIVIRRSGGAIVVAGIADAWTGDPDFAAALDGAPENTDTIVIGHNPDSFPDMPDGPALMLAGHSHCGQVTLPLIGRPASVVHNRAYECHLVQENGRTLYTTGGIGTSTLPVRFLTSPEIVIITLRGRDTPPT